VRAAHYVSPAFRCRLCNVNFETRAFEVAPAAHWRRLLAACRVTEVLSEDAVAELVEGWRLLDKKVVSIP
jgi:hypothetical protein